MPQFEKVKLDLAPLSAGDRAIAVAAPSVACIGWIPFFDDISQLPRCGFRTVALRRRRPLALHPESHLFKSGNARPASINSPEALRDLISRRDFRSIVGLTSVLLSQSAEGQFTHCEF